MELNTKRFLCTHDQIVSILSKSSISAHLDKDTLLLWESCSISTQEAIHRLISNNHSDDTVKGIDPIAFREFAFGLGYRRLGNG